MDNPKKRNAEIRGDHFSGDRRDAKKQKKRNYYRGVGRKSIEPGDSGIFVTCNRKMEPRCVGEMADLFHEHASKLYEIPTEDVSKQDDDDDDDDDVDIDKVIKAELGEKDKTRDPMFTNIKLDSPCLIFFKTRAPVETVSFVRAICTEAADSSKRHTRFAKRLTPITLVGCATEEGLKHVATKVLAPHFHDSPVTEKKFAIRPVVRDHSKGLTKDGIISTVAGLVGKPHRVDLKGYDRLILVDVFKNICGVSVVGNEYEQLKRYNLAEIYEPTARPDTKPQMGEP